MTPYQKVLLVLFTWCLGIVTLARIAYLLRKDSKR
jgi:hypothetical protein